MARFHKVLIANRGEIAVRVIAAARRLGYRTVAVYSAADAGARHVSVADEAVHIGPPPAAESYLSVERILDAARRTGADAVHPGYGFLAENAAFALACEEAGIVWIGPPASAIELMGSKQASKRSVEGVGVLGVPGYHGDDQDDAALLEHGAAVGFPLMVKASAGGGGRGMRVVHDAADLPDALRSARAEATAAFGSGDMILERAVLDARHVEIQVLADQHGATLHLGERDCSVQRRHQKVIEESPSPAVDADLRRAMGEAAVAVARSCGYVGAGTVEFLLESDGSFWFLEMNTRLQVEHPVTEAVTGLDLVELQLRVAAGEPLPFAQEDVRLSGHAIEARLYAEDPDRGFLPQTGRVLRWQPPGGGVRVDHGVTEGGDVSPHYDPMVAKVVVHGADRAEATRALDSALADLLLLGVTNNRSFLQRVLRHPGFVQGRATTTFLAEHEADLAGGDPTLADLAVAALVVLVRACPTVEPELLGWSSGRALASALTLEHGDVVHSLLLRRLGPGRFSVARAQDEPDAEAVELSLVAASDDALTIEADGVRRHIPYAFDGGAVFLPHLTVTDVSGRARASADEGSGTIKAPLDGSVTAVFAQVGDAVTRGQLLLVMEAMKMEHRMSADVDGTLADLPVAVGDQVRTRQLLARITPVEDV